MVAYHNLQRLIPCRCTGRHKGGGSRQGCGDAVLFLNRSNKGKCKLSLNSAVLQQMCLHPAKFILLYLRIGVRGNQPKNAKVQLGNLYLKFTLKFRVWNIVLRFTQVCANCVKSLSLISRLRFHLHHRFVTNTIWKYDTVFTNISSLPQLSLL